MNKSTLEAYRERWKLVEAVQAAELRAKTVEQRWCSVEQLWAFAQEAGLSSRPDPDLEKVRARWIRLKGSSISYSTQQGSATRVREQRAHYSTGPNSALFRALAAVEQLLSKLGDQGIVIGGVAASLIGRPRLTEDIDVVVIFQLDEIELVLTAAASVGIVPRIVDVEVFAHESRVLLLAHAATGIEIDISLGVLPFEVEAVKHATIHQIGDIHIRLPTPEDLIIFKAVAHRAKDLQDIYDIIQANPNLNRKRVRAKVRSFARVLDIPEIWEDIAIWLS
jgi:hypothetical protein